MLTGDIDCLIFSRFRPAQLDLLLRSIREHAAHLYCRVTALVKFDPIDEIQDGYLTVIEEHPWVEFRSQTHYGFAEFVRAWLIGGVSERVSFLVDDDVFWRAAPVPERLPWTFRNGDHDYPFSLDGNVYECDDIIRLLAGLEYRDPTELEAQGHIHRDRLPFRMVWGADPCLVGLNWNRVSERSGVPHAGLDPLAMAERFNTGERLAIPTFDETARPHESPEPVWFTPVTA